MRADPKAVLDWKGMQLVDDADSTLGVFGERTLPWPAPGSFSAREMQLDFSKLLRKES